jgi:hypothetical protein
MTREQYSQTLRYMEHLRELSYEAESPREERRLNREYDALWKSIAPYATGEKNLDDPVTPANRAEP